MQERTPSKPIFILGSGRSGTSILTAALKSGANIPGFGEGHFLPLIGFLMKETKRYFCQKERLRENERHMIAHISRSAMEDSIVKIFKDQCEQIHQSEVWLDKSPTAAMIRAVPYLKRAWPEARFIFAKRRGIENIISRLKKFPHEDFETHCKQWADTMNAWLKVRNQVADASIEIEQREIALYPVMISKRIGEFLELNEVEIEKIAKIFVEKRPQSTGGQEGKRALDIAQTDWSENQIEMFRKHCGKVSIAFGYSEKPRYMEE